MQLKQAIEEIGGMKFVVHELNICSSAGRRVCLSLPFHTHAEVLTAIFERAEHLQTVVRDSQHKNTLSLLHIKLGQLRDIENTFRHLHNKTILSDIELYEIKHFAILAESIQSLLTTLSLSEFDIPSLEEVVRILDPENKRIPHFHIYNQYSDELSALRKKAESAVGEEKEVLLLKTEALEDEIRWQLSDKLFPFAGYLHRALNEIARLDVELAKAELNLRWGLVRPLFSSETTILRGIFHPQVFEQLKIQEKEFQPIDIDIPAKPTVITGANMAGKSVLLKTVALVQAMAQFGFYVPALSAKIVPVEKILISTGDGQDEMRGLSSFASEMLCANAMIQSIEQGDKLLILIDELARTTNPDEGKAIVCGVIDFLLEKCVHSLITTHYAIDLKCRKLRVKGFIEHLHNEKITTQNINKFIDYSLEETSENEVPHEAIRIAEIIGVGEAFLHRVKKIVKQKE